MSTTYIPAALRRLVETRANHRCEYCLLPAGVSFFSHEVDHIVAEKHGGLTDATNLALNSGAVTGIKGLILPRSTRRLGRLPRSSILEPRRGEHTLPSRMGCLWG